MEQPTLQDRQGQIYGIARGREVKPAKAPSLARQNTLGGQNVSRAPSSGLIRGILRLCFFVHPIDKLTYLCCKLLCFCVGRKMFARFARADIVQPAAPTIVMAFLAHTGPKVVCHDLLPE